MKSKRFLNRLMWISFLRTLISNCIWSIVSLWLFLGLTVAYNLDMEHPLMYSGPNGSLFGYSVQLHSHESVKWLLAGAPKANWSSSTSIKNPGAIFKCSVEDNPEMTCEQLHIGEPPFEICGKTCRAEADAQWFGISLSRQLKENGDILACGHRWKNIFYMKHDKLPLGICYRIPSNLETSMSRRLCPCYQDYHRKFGEQYGSCQAGISSFFTQDLVIMGAPGAHYWTGAIMMTNITDNMSYRLNDNEGAVRFGSYLGYAVGAGHFVSPSSTEIIGGAPQQEQTGRAYIFSYERNKLKILFEDKGKKIGSYFGAAVCAADLNADGLSDLLIGAPTYSTVREEGRVYVYINNGNAKMNESFIELSGSDMYAARFGDTISNLGDIDNDGFEDVAVGAPHEDDLQGAVYIYNGRKNGISHSFSQKIKGQQVRNGLSMFGHSISGGIDIDGNGYSDVAVGAFLSDSAVVLRTRAVAIVEASMDLPESFNRSIKECFLYGQPTACMNLTLCFKYRGKEVPGHIVLFYNLTADSQRTPDRLSRFYFITNGTSDVTSDRVNIKHTAESCKTHRAYIRKDVRDLLTPVHFEATYQLGDHIVPSKDSNQLSPLKPILQQREGEINAIRNKTIFARYCVWKNCSANLKVQGSFAVPGMENKSYLTVGAVKALKLKVSLMNDGDDAYNTRLYITLPRNVYFSRILASDESYISCEANDSYSETGVMLNCHVGNFYLESLSKTDISFLLDTSKLIRAENFDILINATCDNENLDIQQDNLAFVSFPLRHEVDLLVTGSVSPQLVVFEDESNLPVECKVDKVDFTFHVVNRGPSIAPHTKLQIMIPNAVVPVDAQLCDIQNVKTTVGDCQIIDENFIPNDFDDCTTVNKSTTFLEDVVDFFSSPTRRIIHCSAEDARCLQVICMFGEIESGMEATVYVYMRIIPQRLSVARATKVPIISSATISSMDDAKTIPINGIQTVQVILEGHKLQRISGVKAKLITIGSCVIGIFLFLLITYILWKCGFFKRAYKDRWKKEDEEEEEAILKNPRSSLVLKQDPFQTDPDFQYEKTDNHEFLRMFQ
ncbi:integrin alpha-4 [Protopterus annectens]|uniref:integrin alpha-4 n=1 Tax=Protopterus annectens TaxID=7888 RepID=UPI001CFBB1D0|nr:integrin alpha-4 [Protopterus annectens]